MMAGPMVREAVTLAGQAERARVARAFVAGVLGPGHPCGDAAALLASELFGNSVLHSGSGAPGETVTVAVSVGERTVRVEVTDRSGSGVPGLSAGRLPRTCYKVGRPRVLHMLASARSEFTTGFLIENALEQAGDARQRRCRGVRSFAALGP